MGRPNSIRGTVLQPRIDRLLDQGMSPQEVAGELASESGAPSSSSVYRYSQWRRGAIVKHFANEPDELTLLARLTEAADSARVARKAALESGSAVALSKAIATEVGILDKLTRQLGVNDNTLSEVADEVSGLLEGLRTLIAEEPDAARRFAGVLAESETERTRFLAKQIRSALGDAR